jgi:hypothetical protein
MNEDALRGHWLNPSDCTPFCAAWTHGSVFWARLSDVAIHAPAGAVAENFFFRAALQTGKLDAWFVALDQDDASGVE